MMSKSNAASHDREAIKIAWDALLVQPTQILARFFTLSNPRWSAQPLNLQLSTLNQIGNTPSAEIKHLKSKTMLNLGSPIVVTDTFSGLRLGWANLA